MNLCRLTVHYVMNEQNDYSKIKSLLDKRIKVLQEKQNLKLLDKTEEIFDALEILELLRQCKKEPTTTNLFRQTFFRAS